MDSEAHIYCLGELPECAGKFCAIHCSVMLLIVYFHIATALGWDSTAFVTCDFLLTMSCLCECCSRCVEFCLEKTQKSKKKKYAGVKYRSPQQANVAVGTAEASSLPMTKTFNFPQSQAQYAVHPQIPQGEERVISVQPRGAWYHKATSVPVPSHHKSLSVPDPFYDSEHRISRGRSRTVSGRLQSTTQGRLGDHSPDLQRRARTLPRKPQMLQPDSPPWRRSCSLPQGTSPTEASSSPVAHLELEDLGHRRQRSSSDVSAQRTDSDSPALTRSRASSISHLESVSMSLPASLRPEGQSSPDTADEPDGGAAAPLPTAQVGNCPCIHFSLYYDVQYLTLTVSLINAENLLPGPSIGLYEPFVALHLEPNKDEIHESTIQRNTLNPHFGESFVFQKLMPDEVRRQTLVLHVYNSKKVKYLIGTALVPLGQVDMFGVPLSAEIDSEAREFRVSSSTLANCCIP